MGNTCSSCGNKISIFVGNKPVNGTIEKAKDLHIYDDTLCQDCLVKKINQYDKERINNQEELYEQALDFLKNIKVTVEHKPSLLEDFGIVSGYSVLGTGPFSEILSGFTDLFGQQSITYIKKIKEAEQFALNILKMNTFVNGGNSVYSCRMQLTEASSGHGMLMFCVTGTAVNDPSVSLNIDKDTASNFIKLYKAKLYTLE